MKKGFTLVEIIVVMAITATVGTILVVIFTNTLRGSNKAQILAVIKQNGQSVLENMDKNIRGADNIVCIDNGSPPKNLVIAKGGIYTRFRFVDPTVINGLIKQDNPVKQPIAVGERDETDAEFIDRVCTQVNDPMTQVTNLTILTDTNPQTGVSATGSFVRSNPPGFKDNVTISFTLSPGVSVPSIISSQIDPVSFQTTIGLR